MSKNRIMIGIIAVAAVAFGARRWADRHAGGSDAVGPAGGTLSLSGAWALYPMAQTWAQEYRKIHPEVTINISAGGAGKGMTDVLAGAVDIGMVSRDVSPEEAARGAFEIAVTKDAVVPVFNADAPFAAAVRATGAQRRFFLDLWITGETLRWNRIVDAAGAENPVTVYTRSDACGAAETWAKYLGKKQEDLKGIGIYGDPGVAEAVRKDRFGIGFNNVNFAYDAVTHAPVAGLLVLPIDTNENGTIDPEENFYDDRDALVAAINDGRYPSPPARNLFFVTRGKPTDPLVAAFIRWVLTEGQRYVPDAGYVDLPPESLRTELAKIS